MRVSKLREVGSVRMINRGILTLSKREKVKRKIFQVL